MFGLARVGIRTRLYAGFAILVALGMIAAGLGWWSTTQVDVQTDKMQALAGNMVRALKIGHDLEIIRRANVRYQTLANADALKEAIGAETRAAELLQEAAKATLSEERRKTYNAMHDGVGSLRGKREALVKLVDGITADKGKLFTSGDEVTATTNKMLEAARATGEQAIVNAARALEANVLLVRVANWRFLATKDASGPATFKTNHERALAAIAEVDKL
ncbi:MAG TPA: methyl-accepting chemotaxis protein, partial [Beijerinckiaceae bacterium]|nr:methyl-accepting chemotaxis protein [Beijerinckiaceae bacterium]